MYLAKWIAAAIALALCGAAFAQEMKDEPRDFRGIAWDSPLEEQRERLSLIREEGDVAYYKRNSEALNFAQAEAIRIGYRYYKNRFSAGVVQTYGLSNQKTLVAALHSMHGTPQRPRKHIEQYVWEGKDAAVVLTCEITTYCAAEFFSVALRKLEVEETGNATTFDRDTGD
jgi:hypothetical protein